MEYGLIGAKLGHSYSKEIHEVLADYCYELQELSPEELGAFLGARSFRALNVTIPDKEAVIPYLDEISERAAAAGAVNTIVNRGGKLYGYNTDFYGLLALIRRSGISLSGKKVMILGTGGTSKTAQAVSKEMDAREIVIISRTGNAGAFTYEEARKVHKDAEILVNATPVGMAPDEEGQPVDLTDFPMLSGMIDVVYHPLRTNLVLQAERFRIPAAGGLFMLAAQAAESMALFRGMIPEEGAGEHEIRSKITEMTEKAYQKVCEEKRNLVLIGMPSSGKSLAGQRISEMTGRPFVNTDDLVEARLGEPVPDFIRREGEAAFRAYERETIREVSALTGHVIATGGGAVLDPDNVRRLTRNGKLIFLRRSLETLKPLEDRPLSDTPEKLARMYEARRPIYEAAADAAAEGCEDPEESAKAVLWVFLGEEA